MTWEEKQEEIEETLRHYGISGEEIKGQSFGYYKTKDEPFKQMYGICELEKLHESKKFRAIIDYDADWEHYIIRFLSHDTQEGSLEGGGSYAGFPKAGHAAD